ncbi:MAG: hypothetical protein VYA95_03555, partial [Candidatus Thermoplasmatota archaeon]|nr:hypothetical protein [Candidatus Thermoplasmatota archaeon]
MDRMPIWQVAIRRLEIPITRFLLLYVGGATLLGLISAISVIFVTGGFGEGALFQGFAGFLMIIVLPILAGLAALSFPILEVQKSATRIEKEMHMFITRMGILSLGEVGAKSIFDILKQMSDYGELA